MITNPYNQSYIGQSIDIESRFNSHKRRISSNHHLSLSIDKHGIENHTFEVLEECLPDNLRTIEKYYISFYKKKIILFNFTVTGFYFNAKDVINNPDFIINELNKRRNEKFLIREKILNKLININLKVSRKIINELGKEKIQEIAEQAVNKEYLKTKKTSLQNSRG